MSYKVYVDNFSRDDWERYAKEFADYSIYQTWPYQQVRAEMDSQQLSRIIIKDENGHVVTMGQIRIKHYKPLCLRIGYVQWGPLMRSRNGEIICSPQALKLLHKSYLGTRVNVLRVLPHIYKSEGGDYVIDIFQAAGFEHSCSFTPYHTMIFPLNTSEEEMHKRLHRKWRSELKKAEQKNIQIRESPDGEYLKILDKLYMSAQRRKKFKGLDMQVYFKTQQLLLPWQKMNVVLAYLDGEPLTADVTSYLGDTAVGLFQASSEKGLRCGASYLVWWRTLLAAKRAGMKMYDLGGVDLDRNPNVYQFKSRMGAKEAFHVGTFEACNSLRTKLIWRTSERIYNLITK